MVSEKGGLKINLGCGNLWKADWENLDGGFATWFFWCRRLPLLGRLVPRTTQRYPRNLVIHDLRKPPLPFRDGSASVIFSGSVLEYLTGDETLALLRDCRRILRPGGLIRLCQVNIGTIIDCYCKNFQDHPSAAAVENARHFLDRCAPERLQWSVRLFRGGGHHQLFDKPSVEFFLGSAGFVDIRFYKHGEGECPDLASIERSEDLQAPWLHVEAKTPAAP